MKVQKFLTATASIFLLFLIGCAKELPQELPETVQPNVFSLKQAKSGSVTIETTEGRSSKAIQVNDASVRGIFALNEKSIYPVKVVNDTTGLGKLFKKLTIESSSPGNRYLVKFKIAHNSLVAYIKRQDVSEHMYDLVGSDYMLPLFEYPIAQFGVIEAVKNALGEETQDLQIISKNKADATHFQIDPTIENRTLAGLRGLSIDEKVEFLLKKNIDNTILSLNSIKSLFPNSNYFNSFVSQKFKLHIFKDRLYFLEAVAYETLNAIERVALKANNDSRLKACNENEAQAFASLESCFWKPIAYLPLEHTKIIRKIDEAGFAVAEPLILEGVNPNQSQIVRIDLHEKVSEGVYFNQDLLPLKYFDKRDLHQKLLTIAEVKQRFTNHAVLDLLPSANVKNLMLYIFKNKLYFLTPASKKELNKIELLALNDANDPRIQKCDSKVSAENFLENTDCVLKPFASISLRHVLVNPTLKEDDYQIPITNIISDADSKKSNVVNIVFEEQMDLDYIGQNIYTKDQIFTSKKAQYDLSKKYIYVPMTLGTPREVAAAAPFFQGNERVVYMKWVKEGLQIYEKDKDFDTNLNEKPVLTIGGKFIDFKCRDENDASCDAIEVIDHDITEDKARFFIPNLEKVNFAQTNTLDLYFLDSDPCVIQLNQKLVDHTIKKGVINFQIEKEYKLSDNFSCLINNYYSDTTNFNGLATTGFKVQYYYSMVALEDLASPNYEKISYPEEDHSIFGFFKDREESLRDDFSDTDEEYYLSRWNPKKKTLVYHLSDSYNEPGQELIKKATYDSVSQINKALRMANSGLQIEVKEPSGKLPGDLRYNVLQLITDPLDNGLLGYAPTVTNPETGEIVQGHINMYAGVLKSTSSWVWDQMIQLTKEQQEKPFDSESVKDIDVLLEQFQSNNGNVDEDTLADAQDDVDASDANATESRTAVSTVKIAPQSDKLTQLFASYHKNLKIEKNKVQQLVKKMKKFEKVQLAKVRPVDRRDPSELNELEKRLQFFEKRIDWYARNNAYSVEAFKIANTVKELLPGIDKIPGVFKADGTLKEWNDLNATQRKKAIDIIVVYSYTSTFVHEFGHNLGLRHNFSGSFDKANFYTPDEMKNIWKGSLSAKVPAYSSIMDYAFSTLNESTVFGKYDIAALRFAYAREIETESGKMTKLPKGDFKLRDFNAQLESAASQLEAQAAQLREAGDEAGAKALEAQAKETKPKSFAFCTDENAGTGLTCDRFDEGTSLTEIIQHKIEKYHSYYKYRNLRRDKKWFSQLSLGSYLISRFYEFIDIRRSFEEWESFVDILSEDLMVMGCTPDLMQQYPDFCVMINDRRDAVKIASKFFLDIIKEPEASCIVAKPADPNAGIQIKTLYSIYDEVKFNMNYAPMSCYDQNIVAQLATEGEVVLAEAGRYLNSFNDFNPKFNLTTDIAVRGVWIDKVLAMKSLFQRKESIFSEDAVHKAMIDHPEISEDVQNLVKHIMLGEQLTDGTLFSDDKGNKYRVNYQLDQISKIDSPHPYVDWVADFLGVPNSGKADVNRALFKNAYEWGLTTPDRTYLEQSLTWMNQFAVHKWDRSEPFNTEGLLTETIKGISYGASAEENPFVFEIIQNSNGLDFLKGVDPALIAQVFTRRTETPYCQVDDPADNADIDPIEDPATDPVVEPSEDPVSEDIASEEPQDPPIVEEPTFCVVKDTNEELAWNMELPLIRALINLRIQGVPLTLAQLIPQFGEEKSKEILEVYKLEALQMATIVQERALRQTAPQGSSQDVVTLYSLNTTQLESFLTGELEAMVQRQLPKLELLPELVIFQ